MIRIQRFIQDMGERQWLEKLELPQWHMQKASYIRPGEYVLDERNVGVQTVNPLCSTHGTTYFLTKQAAIPQDWHDGAVGFIFEAGGEGLLKVNGAPYHGLDRNHWYVPLPVDRVGSTPLLEIELYDPIPEPHDPLNRQAVIQPPIKGIRSALVRVNQPLQSLMYSVTVLSESLKAMPENDGMRSRLMGALHSIMDQMYSEPNRWDEAEWVTGLEQLLAQRVREEDPEGGRGGFMHLVGQSHIDIAWLWPVRETIRKSSRTFSTVCTLMDEYPEFLYSQSQPQLYAFVKEHYPQLYERIKVRIAEGRWELVGGMWVEPDLNIPSGESLVRQILYGQSFYQKEFGKRSIIEWLPDTFGYCASLPQILKLADIPYFMTTKLNWNDTNVFPYDLFNWVGIDGTSIIAYLNHGVNEHTHPKDVDEHWKSYKQKNAHPQQMLLYGHGDGGGGVTNEMVELAERSSFMVGQPVSRFSTAGAFFEGVQKSGQSLPNWHGDLYLELHRGTYTTHARNKRSNRKAEVLYREAELWGQFSGLSQTVTGILDEGWKLILLNQFHDIIPGTSIPEVYATSAEEYGKIAEIGTAALACCLESIAGRITSHGEGLPYLVFNSLGWERGEVVSLTCSVEKNDVYVVDANGEPLDFDVERNGDSQTVSVYVPCISAFGYTTIWLRAALQAENAWTAPTEEAFPSVWETDFYILEFNESGEITRWYDKPLRREWLKPGERANELQFFHDRPTYWDAWDIDPRFEAQRAGTARLISKKVVLRGSTKDVLRFQWRLNDSEISQDMILYRHQRRVDFQTRVSWAESHKLLKAAFPVDLVAAKATYEIPFGALERPTHNNTSWEQAQFEVCGHRWADLSEGNGGLSVLNDCKYGYDIKDRTIRLSLLRAPKWPDAHADQGEQVFTYAVLPHQGDWREAHAVRRAMELNHPVIAVEGRPNKAVGACQPGHSAVLEHPELPVRHAWLSFESDHVILDTIKASEDGTGTVLRFYESSGGRETVLIQWPDEKVKAFVVNLLEDERGQLPCERGAFELAFKPFEIKTVKLVSLKEDNDK